MTTRRDSEAGNTGEPNPPSVAFAGVAHRTSILIALIAAALLLVGCAERASATTSKSTEVAASTTKFSDGTWLIEQQIAPGSYSTPDSGKFCDFTLSGPAAHDLDGGHFNAGATIVIESTDTSITASGGCMWTKAGS